MENRAAPSAHTHTLFTWLLGEGLAEVIISHTAYMLPPLGNCSRHIKLWKWTGLCKPWWGWEADPYCTCVRYTHAQGHKVVLVESGATIFQISSSGLSQEHLYTHMPVCLSICLCSCLRLSLFSLSPHFIFVEKKSCL